MDILKKSRTAKNVDIRNVPSEKSIPGVHALISSKVMLLRGTFCFAATGQQESSTPHAMAYKEHVSFWNRVCRKSVKREVEMS